jgi:hypothetical protein
MKMAKLHLIGAMIGVLALEPCSQTKADVQDSPFVSNPQRVKSARVEESHRRGRSALDNLRNIKNCGVKIVGLQAPGVPTPILEAPITILPNAIPSVPPRAGEQR